MFYGLWSIVSRGSNGFCLTFEGIFPERPSAAVEKDSRSSGGRLAQIIVVQSRVLLLHPDEECVP